MGRPPKNAFDEATVTRVLRAAEAAFGSRGFSQARLEDIAQEAGIRRPSLLYHFKNKESLYQEVVKQAFRELRQVSAVPITSAGTFQERLEGVTLALLTFAEDRPHLLPLVIRAIIDDRAIGRAIVRDEFVPLIDLLESFVRAQGGSTVPDGTPIRAAIVQLFIAHMVMSASGELAPLLWPEGARTQTLMRNLFLRGTSEASGEGATDPDGES